MDKKIDRLLSHALSKGNEVQVRKIFEQIYRQYYKLVAFCVAKYTKDMELIKDITNEAFLKLYQNAAQVKGSVKYYLLSTARNLAINHQKKIERIVCVEDIETINHAVDENHSHALYIELLEDLRSVLSEQEVQIILKHSVDGLSFKELESIFNIKAKTLNKMFERAIKKFKNSNRSKWYES